MSATIVDDLEPYFDRLELTPADWPVRCSIVFPNERARARWTTFPRAATPTCGRAGNGRGVDAAACMRSGIGEAIEIASVCAWGDESIVFDTQTGIGPAALSPAELIGFSTDQLHDRVAWNLTLDETDWIPHPYSTEQRIGWLAAKEAASGAEVWVPADAVLMTCRDPGSDAVAIADTSGCAAGSMSDSARLSALLELIERDAVGRWWYGVRERPQLDPSLSPSGDVIVRHLAARGRVVRIFDITTDIGVPTVAAVAHDQGGGAVAVGFSAKMHLIEAIEDALAELMQMDFLVAAARATGMAKPTLARWLGEVKGTTPPLGDLPAPAGTISRHKSIAEGSASCDAKRDLATCLSACAQRHCRILFIDHTRREFALPVWRAISPDLCHWKPRLGRARLLAPDPRDRARGPAPDLKPNPVVLRI